MLELILSAVESIMQVVAIVFTGVILSKNGYIDNDKQKWLSKLNLVFFTPCLLFSNIASVMSFEKLLAFWPIPAFYIVFTLLSWVLSKTVMPIFGINRYYKRFVLACAMFCNTNSLPVAIISSLAVSEAGKSLYWGPKDSQEMVSARGISYTLFFGLFVNILRWSYGYALLQKQSDKDDDVTMLVRDISSTSSIVHTHHADSNSTNAPFYNSVYSSSNHKDDFEHHNNHSKKCNSSINISSSSFDAAAATTVTESTNLMLSSFPRPDDFEKKKTYKSIFNGAISVFASLDKYMSPPLYAVILALFVALCPPLKHFMYSKDSFFYVSITKAIDLCGKASVPLVLVCLGAQLRSIRKTHSNSGVGIEDEETVTSPAVVTSQGTAKKPIALSIFIRMFLMPLCVLPLVFAFQKYGQAWSDLASDPVFIVSMIVVGCTPTAINLSQITMVSGMFEEEMLSVLFWSYGVVCIPVCTLVVFLALYMVSIV